MTPYQEYCAELDAINALRTRLNQRQKMAFEKLAAAQQTCPHPTTQSEMTFIGEMWTCLACGHSEEGDSPRD